MQRLFLQLAAALNLPARFFALTLLALLIAQPLCGQNRVSIFKNGSGFFQRGTTLSQSADGRWVLDSLPSAAFGTFWLSAPGLQSVSRQEVPVVSTRPLASRTAFFEANLGKQLRIVYSNYGNELPSTFTGTLQNVVDGNILVENGANWHLMPMSRIDQFVFVDAAPARTYQDTTQRASLVFGFESTPRTAPQASSFYLQRGIVWLPNYYLAIDGKGKGRLLMRATIMNDAEPIVNATVDLVVGVPNFLHELHASPLTSGQSVEQFLSTLNRSGSANDYYSNAVVAQRAYGGDDAFGGYDAFGDDFSYEGSTTNTAQSSAEDLFFYTLPNFSLPKGGRAVHVLIDTEMEYEDYYEAHFSSFSGSNYATGQTPTGVEHRMRVTNAGKQPWTTAPLLVSLREGSATRPLGQTIMEYTPIGTQTSFALNKAVDVRIFQEEEVIRRSEEAVKIGSYTYHEVTVRVTVRLRNAKNKAISLEMDRQVMGKLRASDVEWQTREVPQSARDANGTSYAKWVLALQGGEQRSFTYTYSFLERR